MRCEKGGLKVKVVEVGEYVRGCGFFVEFCGF